MAYDEAVAARIRDAIGNEAGLSEKKMFGGIAFLLMGNMACGVNKDDLIVRMGPEESESAVDEPAARLFDLTGRPMKGWICVGREGYADDDDLRRWVDRGVSYARSLPPK